MGLLRCGIPLAEIDEVRETPVRGINMVIMLK